MAEPTLPLPGVKHGKRILVSTIENRAQNNSDRPWVSMPVNEQDLSQGYKDISFWQLNNYANHAAGWLNDNLPQTSEPFQCFAYAGPKDLRYAILAVAAAKLQKVVILPSPLVPPDGQKRILNAKNCCFYLRPASLADQVGVLLKGTPHIQAITVPEIGHFMQETEATRFTYPKTWEDGKDDPWLVFHTSGTTGFPKPITFTHRMMAAADVLVGTPGVEPTLYSKLALQRIYTPLPSLHIGGTMMSLMLTTFINSSLVTGHPTFPSPETVIDILHHGRVEGVLFTPALIEELCRTAAGFDALRKLKCILYAGAPLASSAGEKLIPHVEVLPAVGSTEAGNFHVALHGKRDAWDYIKFQKQTGATFEHRFNDLYELVFVRQPDISLQQIFHVYPHLDRFETSDLWVKHPVHKDLWKIVGRADDYMALSHGEGLYAASIEPVIEAHSAIKSAVIGGHGRPAPVLIVELYPEERTGEKNEQEFLASLQPYIDQFNAQVHECVRLSLDRVILTKEDKPFVRTIKGTVARLQSLDLYKDEIAALFDRQ